jgi:glycosyltransferase involved in cell wall biosynthesis
MKRPSLLIAHPWMARGGSEATAMWALEALMPDHEITFVTAAPLRERDWDSLNRAYGTRVDPSRMRVLKAPALPGVAGPRSLPHLQVRYFERFCRGIAASFDRCLSAYNPIFFGRPAIQLIGDFSFCEDMRVRLHAHGKMPLRHRPSPARRLYLKLGEWIEVEKPPLREWDDLILANSAWAARQLEERFRLPRPGVLHPPVPLPPAPPAAARDPFSFVCLGRVVPEKEVERVIHILARLRAEGFPVTLTIAGDVEESEYARGVADLAASQGGWVATPGFLHLEEKRTVLSTRTFAIHACRIEAFGIAVAEMAAMGCVPFVPASGGAGEIVPFPELQFSTDDEAAAKIAALLRDPARVRELATRMPAQAAGFAPERFAARLREHVLHFGESRAGRDHASPQENLRAPH